MENGTWDQIIHIDLKIDEERDFNDCLRDDGSANEHAGVQYIALEVSARLVGNASHLDAEQYLGDFHVFLRYASHFYNSANQLHVDIDARLYFCFLFKTCRILEECYLDIFRLFICVEIL